MPLQRNDMPEEKSLNSRVANYFADKYGIVFSVTLALLAIWGLRSTVINGITYPLKHGMFRGDFSGATFDTGWLEGVCSWQPNVAADVVGTTQYGHYERGIEIFYGPLFTIFQHVLVENRCIQGLDSVTSTPRVDVDSFLIVVTIINLLLIVASLWVLYRVFEFSYVEWMAISTLWLIDSHLSYALSVAAIPEFLELWLIVSAVLLLRDKRSSAQYLSGILIGIGAVIKLVPLIMFPLLLFRRSHTVHRVAGCIGTIMTVIVATSIGLRIPLLTTVKETFIPVQATQNSALETRNLLSIFTPQTNSEFQSLSGSIARVTNVEATSINGSIIGIVSVVIIVSLYLVAVWYTVTLRRRGSSTSNPREPGMLLVAGLYCSLLPLINIAHRHTYLFLIATYALIYYAASRLFSPPKRNRLLAIGGILYLWSSQGLLAATLTHLGISHPLILHEEALPNLALTVLIVIMICLYEKQGGFGSAGQLEPPTRELAETTSQTRQGVSPR